MVAHALTYWPNVGAFGPSGPSHLTYPPLWKLQYTSKHPNVTHASIVAHATYDNFCQAQPSPSSSLG